MQQSRRGYVEDLRAWDLLRLEELEEKLTDELAGKARVLYFDRGLFAEEFYSEFLDRLRTLGGAAVNETIEYWLKGLADGHDGQFPEFAVELPYLERSENIDALTVAYCVANEDGTRTELIRTTLESVLRRVIEDRDRPEDLDRRIKVVASELRTLATALEKDLSETRRARD